MAMVLWSSKIYVIPWVKTAWYFPHSPYLLQWWREKLEQNVELKMSENVRYYVVGGVVIGVVILIISLIATSLEKLDSDEGLYTMLLCHMLNYY